MPSNQDKICQEENAENSIAGNKGQAPLISMFLHVDKLTFWRCIETVVYFLKFKILLLSGIKGL